MKTINVSTLTDSQLILEVSRLSQSERDTTASLIAHLAELYGRRLHENSGYGSLFTYCVSVLRMSESAAYDRMKAAKVARRFPSVLDGLAEGRLNLTTVRLVAPHLTSANHQELLTRLAGLSKRQVQEELARRFPQPDLRASVRKLPRPAAVMERVAPAALLTAANADESARPPAPLVASALPRPAETQSMPEPVKPLSPDRYRITFTASAAACAKLEMAQDLLRHVIPSGDAAQIFERALDALVQDLVQKKFAVTAHPRESRGQRDDSRHIPAEVKRTVYIRDRGQCAYVSSEGRRCEQRGFLEFHHVQPYAAGGKAAV